MLNRRYKKSTQKFHATSSHFHEAIPIPTLSPSFKDKESDDLWRNVILVLPHAAVFYIASLIGENRSVQGPVQALLISWLRIHRTTGCPAIGGLFKSFTHVYEMPTGCFYPRYMINAYQLDDKEEGAPLLPPDKVQYSPGQQESTGSFHKEMKEFYNKNQNPTSKLGASFRKNCRMYVKGTYHQDIPSSCYKLDQRDIGDVDLVLTLRTDKGRPRSLSIIQVRALDYETNVTDKELLKDLMDALRAVARMPKNCRHTLNDGGAMQSIGVRKSQAVGIEQTKPTEYLLKHTQLTRICHLAYLFANRRFTTVVQTMQHIESQVGRTPIHKMGGNLGPSCCMSVSCSNLRNATHYDIHGGSVCFSIWSEGEPGNTRNWYFVLPNCWNVVFAFWKKHTMVWQFGCSTVVPLHGMVALSETVQASVPLPIHYQELQVGFGPLIDVLTWNYIKCTTQERKQEKKEEDGQAYKKHREELPDEIPKGRSKQPRK